MLARFYALQAVALENMRNIDTSFLFEYLESVKANHPDSKAKNDHVSKVSTYVYADIRTIATQVTEIENQQLIDVWNEVVTIIGQKQ